MKKYDSYYEKMTCQPIPSLLVQLSIPTIISMLVSNIYNMVDTAFVGRISTSASGAVGVVFGFMSIIQAVGFMLGHGSGSILSRMLGRKDEAGASRTASTGFFCALGAGTLIAVLGFLFLDPLVRILGSTETIAPYAKDYIRFILIATPIMVPTFSLNNLLRYEGKATLGMVGVMVGAILNIALDPILMFGLNMGIAGAGLATCASQYISFGILLSFFLRGKTQTRLSFRMADFRIANVADITATGLPSLLRQVLNSLATILLNQQAAAYGDAAVAAMSIVSRIIFFVFAISLGIGQGFQPISGFSYGAGKFTRLRKAFRMAVLLSESVLIVITIAVLWRSADVMRLFRDDTQVIAIGTRALRLQLIAELAMPACMMVEMLLQSTGKRFWASLLSSSRSGLCFIPSLLILSYFRGLAGIQEAQPLAFLLACIPTFFVAISYFRQLPKEDRPET